MYIICFLKCDCIHEFFPGDKDSLLKKMKTVDNQGQATMSSRKKTLQQKSRDDPDNDQGIL